MKNISVQPEMLQPFDRFAKEVQKDHQVIVQLGKRFGRRLSYLAGESIDEQFLLPSKNLELSESMVFSIFGFEKLSSSEKEKLLMKVEAFKRVFEKEKK